MKRPVLFIILNIIISAATTLIVLLVWDAAHKRAEPQLNASGDPTQSIQLSECDGTIPSGDKPLLSVINITGIGDINKEEITFGFFGSETVCLNGWLIKGKANKLYAFPQFYQLYTEGVQIKLRSRVGEDTALELYWDQEEPVWKSGEVIDIIDPRGSIHDSFLIP